MKHFLWRVQVCSTAKQQFTYDHRMPSVQRTNEKCDARLGNFAPPVQRGRARISRTVFPFLPWRACALRWSYSYSEPIRDFIRIRGFILPSLSGVLRPMRLLLVRSVTLGALLQSCGGIFISRASIGYWRRCKEWEMSVSPRKALRLLGRSDDTWDCQQCSSSM